MTVYLIYYNAMTDGQCTVTLAAEQLIKHEISIIKNKQIVGRLQEFWFELVYGLRRRAEGLAIHV